MAARVPVVCSDAGGLVETVADCAQVVPAGSVASLRNALYRISFELGRAEREEIIRRGLERSRQFTWTAAARETIGAFERTLGNSG